LIRFFFLAPCCGGRLRQRETTTIAIRFRVTTTTYRRRPTDSRAT